MRRRLRRMILMALGYSREDLWLMTAAIMEMERHYRYVSTRPPGVWLGNFSAEANAASYLEDAEKLKVIGNRVFADGGFVGGGYVRPMPDDPGAFRTTVWWFQDRLRALFWPLRPHR